MDIHQGGGQGLRATTATEATRPRRESRESGDAAAQADPFQQRYGADIYDETDDPDYNIQDDMSRMTMDDDELSFDVNSVAASRAPGFGDRSVAGRSTVSFGARSAFGVPPSSASVARKSILKNASSPGAALGVKGVTSTKKGAFYFGGAMGSYSVDRWADSKACKR